MIDIRNKKDCSGCKACMQICPRHCISFKEDREGFVYPIINHLQCIDCHLCEKVCPFHSVGQASAPVKVYAAYNRNIEDRAKSSSGGMFILMAKNVIENGGVVFGAVFDESWMVKHTYSETIEGVYAMLQSKYAQSDIGNSFIEVKKFLTEGRQVLFCGTPCQVAGLNHFLRKDYPNLITVDFLCHGVPSPGVWRKYVEKEIIPLAPCARAGKNSVLNLSINAVSVITDIEFRDKSYRGWKKYSFVVRQKSASKADKNTVLLSDSHYDNPYMRGFLSDVFLRPSCYDCKCKNGRSGSDITIGDFWCADKVDKNIDDDKGLSLILINNSDKVLLDESKCYYKEFLYESIRHLNGGFVEKHKKKLIRRLSFYFLYRFLNMSNSLRFSLFITNMIYKILNK